MIDALLLSIVVPLTPCDRAGGFYNPGHQSCGPYLPANEPGNVQYCFGFYDTEHGVCYP